MGKADVTKIHKGTTVVGDVEVQTVVVVPTPECDKLLKVSEDSNKIGAFLDWLMHEQEVELCTLERDRWFPLGRSIQDLLADYFGIDQKKVERERRALLEAIRR